MGDLFRNESQEGKKALENAIKRKSTDFVDASGDTIMATNILIH